MRKIILSLSLILMLICPVFLTGCGSELKTVAKNLDDTVTNLIYTISTLDWANNTTLDSISNEANYEQNDNNEISTLENQNLNNTNQLNYNYLNQYNNIDNSQLGGNYTNNQCINNCPNCNLNTNYEQNGNNLYSNSNQQNYTTIRNRSYNNSVNRIRESSIARNEMSGTNKNRISLTKETKSRLPQSNTSSFNGQTINNNNNTMVVSYSTSNIKNSLNTINDKISDLVDKRANIILYVNALYNKNISLTQEDITAVNAYINIIKDNTSYLKSNNGMVTNQLSQAQNIKENNCCSPLINAYIIRTSEVIETRIAKLNACLMALDSIIDILNEKTTVEIPNTQSQSYPEININQPLAENTEKITTENKTANNDNDIVKTDELANILNNKNEDSNINNNNDCNNCENCDNCDNSNECENNAKLGDATENLENNKNIENNERILETKNSFTEDNHSEKTLPIIEKMEAPIIDSDKKINSLNYDIIKTIPY